MMIINKSLCFLAFFLALAVPAFAYTNYTYNTFNDNLTSKNFTFMNDQNITSYFNIPINANMTTAQITVKGYPLRHCYQESADESTLCGGLSTGSYSISDDYNDGNWSGDYTNMETYSAIINYSKPADSIGAYFQLKYGFVVEGFPIGENVTINNTISEECFSQTDILVNLTGKQAGGIAVQTLIISCWNGTAYTEMNSTTTYFNVYEEGIWWDMNNTLYTNNTYIEIGTDDNNREWNNTGKMNKTFSSSDVNITPVKNYLASCIPDNSGNCTIPFLIHSDTGGVIEVSALQLNFTDVFVWVNTTPTSRTVSMPLSYSDSFAIVVTNKGAFTKSFTIGCEGSLCTYFSVTNNLASNMTDQLDYNEASSFTATCDPIDDSVSAGSTYKGNITVNNSDTLNKIALEYYLGMAAGVGGSVGGGGTKYVQLIPECPEGYEAVKNPVNGTYECIITPVPLLEAENFLLEYPVLFGFSLWTIIISLLSGYMIYRFTQTKQLTYGIGAAMLIFIWAITMPTGLYIAFDNILNSTSSGALNALEAFP